jgi:hypothetical protein
MLVLLNRASVREGAWPYNLYWFRRTLLARNDGGHCPDPRLSAHRLLRERMTHLAFRDLLERRACSQFSPTSLIVVASPKPGALGRWPKLNRVAMDPHNPKARSVQRPPAIRVCNAVLCHLRVCSSGCAVAPGESSAKVLWSRKRPDCKAKSASRSRH